jgi:hypothetical protein
VKDVINGSLDVIGFRDILLDESKMGMIAEVSDIASVTRDKVIQSDDAKAIGKEKIDEMGRNKSGSAGNDCCFHRNVEMSLRRTIA